MTAAKTTHIGGRMYGDGEYVVDFDHVDSDHAPMRATVMAPDGTGYSAGPFEHGTRPSVLLAAQLIARVRAMRPDDTVRCDCGEPEDGGEFGFFTDETGTTVCNACGNEVD